MAHTFANPAQTITISEGPSIGTRYIARGQAPPAAIRGGNSPSDPVTYPGSIFERRDSGWAMSDVSAGSIVADNISPGVVSSGFRFVESPSSLTPIDFKIKSPFGGTENLSEVVHQLHVDYKLRFNALETAIRNLAKTLLGDEDYDVMDMLADLNEDLNKLEDD